MQGSAAGAAPYRARALDTGSLTPHKQNLSGKVNLPHKQDVSGNLEEAWLDDSPWRTALLSG